MSKRSIDTRLTQARNALALAREACPHWDNESEPDPHAHECCAALDSARASVRAVKRETSK